MVIGPFFKVQRSRHVNTYVRNLITRLQTSSAPGPRALCFRVRIFVKAGTRARAHGRRHACLGRLAGVLRQALVRLHGVVRGESPTSTHSVATREPVSESAVSATTCARKRRCLHNVRMARPRRENMSLRNQRAHVPVTRPQTRPRLAGAGRDSGQHRVVEASDRLVADRGNGGGRQAGQGGQGAQGRVGRERGSGRESGTNRSERKGRERNERTTPKRPLGGWRGRCRCCRRRENGIGGEQVRGRAGRTARERSEWVPLGLGATTAGGGRPASAGYGPRSTRAQQPRRRHTRGGRRG